MSTPDELSRQDVEAALETRRELGVAYEREVVDAFADRVEATVQARVDARLAQQRYEYSLERRGGAQQLALSIVSLMTGIPITAITLNTGPDEGRVLTTVVAWGGIAVVNLANAWRGRARRS